MKKTHQFFKWLAMLVMIIASTTGAKAGTGDQTVCIGSTHNYSVVATTGSTYTWSISGAASAKTYTPSTTNQLSSVTWNTVGTYTIEVIERNESGCDGTPKTINVTVEPLPTATISGTTAVCLGGTAPIVTFTGAGGTAPYTFTYKIGSGSNQTVSTTLGNSSVTVSAPTGTAGSFVYTLVSVQDSKSCSQSQTGTATITVDDLPTAGLASSDADNKICAGESVTFTATGGTSYEFFVGATSQGAASATATFTTSSLTNNQVVTVKVTNASGCSATSSGITTTVNDLPTAGLVSSDADNKICAGESVTFTANGGTLYEFFVGATSQGAASATATFTTSSLTNNQVVTVKVTNASGCSATSSGITTTVNPLPTATISGTTAVCLGGTAPNVTFTGAAGTAPYTFTYNIGGGANQTVTTNSGNSVTVPAPTGTAGSFVYNLVSVQDANTCSQNQTGTVTIKIDPLPSTSPITWD